LDVNDELRGADFLRAEAHKFADTPTSGFLICQEWFSGARDKYYNLRFIKARNNWRYKGRVHEYIEQIGGNKNEIHRLPDSIILFQDRTKDDDKSFKRFSRDKVLLLEDFKANPKDPRTLFYLAQTCACLNEADDAFYYYKLRSNLPGFYEEVFQSLLRCGDFSAQLGHDWHQSSLGWYMRAYEHTARVEPVLKIAEYYLDKKQWVLAYTFSKLACSLSYPDHCILFVDKHVYDYKRWHILGIAAWYAGSYDDGKNACLKAIACGYNNDIDKKNLEFYENRERESTPTPPSSTTSNLMTRAQFSKLQAQKIKVDHPNLSQKQIDSRVDILWKQYRSNNS
jgi:hypothetical protein